MEEQRGCPYQGLSHTACILLLEGDSKQLTITSTMGSILPKKKLGSRGRGLAWGATMHAVDV